MARASKKAGNQGADAPDAAPKKGRKPAAPRPRKRTSPPAAESVVVAQEAGEVVIAGAPGPDLAKSLRADQEAAARELTQCREEARAAARQFLQESRDGADRVRRECEATTAQLAEVKRQVQEAGRRLLAEFESQLGLASRELQAARDQLRAIPQQADEYRQRVEEMGRRLPEAEGQLREIARTSGTTRQDLDRAERESRDARKRLDAVRYETAQEEARLAAVRNEFREVEERLRELRRQLDRVSDEAADARDRTDAKSPEGGETAADEPSKVRNRFGVTVDPGVVVADVLPGTPAEAAGLARGDVVTAVNNSPVFTGVELRDRVREVADGEEVTLRVNRGGAIRDVTTRLGTPPTDGEEDRRNRMGVTVQPGVIVAEVQAGTPAAAAELTPGDVIAEVNGMPVLTGEQLREALSRAAGREIVLRVSRGGVEREVAAWPGEGSAGG
jgi:C-terminal processing protease CtpA/Prc